jgi:hypothetical protein
MIATAKSGNVMKNISFLLSAALISLLIGPALAEESREAKQARLDAVCEAARQAKLAPLRYEYIGECVTNKELPSKQECERFYADYGERMGRRAPLYYDLPECVTAFDFQQGNGD